MTTTATNAWMPSGRHQVNIGASLVRALKTRRGHEPIKNNKLKPDREFYSFRYNFKPESIDITKPGTIEIKNPKDEAGTSKVSSEVGVVRSSTQNAHGVKFTGKEDPAKEFECVLIYDEETGTITLEKIDSFVTLQHDHRTIHTPRHLDSPTPAVPPRMSASASASNSHTRQPSPVKQEEEESEGEIPETKPKPSSRPPPTATANLKSKPRATSPPSSVAAPIPPTSSRPVHTLPPKPAQTAPKPKPKVTVTAVPPPAPKQAPAAAPDRGLNKRERPEEETLEIRRPKKHRVIPPVKAPSPPPKSPNLSFPDPSNAVSLPPAPVSAVPRPVSTSAPILPPVITPAPPPVTATTVSDSDEEEWDEVQTSVVPLPATATAATTSHPTIVMEEIEPSAFTPSPEKMDILLPPIPIPPVDENEGEEIDMAAFEEELNGQLLDPDAMGVDDEEEDFLAVAVSPVTQVGQPVSLAEYAGGGAVFGDDDDYSSSDESEDD